MGNNLAPRLGRIYFIEYPDEASALEEKVDGQIVGQIPLAPSEPEKTTPPASTLEESVRHSILYRAYDTARHVVRKATGAPSRVLGATARARDGTVRILRKAGTVTSNAASATPQAAAGLARRTLRYTRWGLIAVGATVTAGLYGLIGPLPQTLDSKRDSFRASCVNSVVETLTDTAYDSWKDSVKYGSAPKDTGVMQEVRETGKDVEVSFGRQVPATLLKLNQDLKVDAAFSEKLKPEADKLWTLLCDETVGKLISDDKSEPSPAGALLLERFDCTVPQWFVSKLKTEKGYAKLHDGFTGWLEQQASNGIPTLNTPADLDSIGHYIMSFGCEAWLDAYNKACANQEPREPLVVFAGSLLGKGWDAGISGKPVASDAMDEKWLLAGKNTLNLLHEGAQRTLHQRKGQIMYADDALYIYNHGDYFEFNLTKTGTQRRMNDILALAEYTKAQVQNAGVRVDPREIRASSNATMEVDVLFFQKWGSRILAAVGGFLGTVLDPSYTIPLDPEFRRLNEPDYRFATRSADRCVEEAMLEAVTPGTDRQLCDALLGYAERRYREAALDIEQRHADCPNCRKPAYVRDGCVALGFKSKDMELAPPNPKLVDLLEKNAIFCSEDRLEAVVPLRKDDDDSKSYEQNRLRFI
ncbi:hypothetical protein HY642_05845, partial [Candidatus Woesearchaeota archaeon]|nr:hypothetical protein [Candidatus Woesearchaeota archaeon]